MAEEQKEGPPGENNPPQTSVGRALQLDAPLDISKILLPKKDASSIVSAQRINAGLLFEQEEVARQEGAPTESTAQKVQEPAPVPTEDQSIKPIQTYQRDIERVVQEKNVSVLSIAAAEAGRREEAPISAPTFIKETPRAWTVWFVVGGVLLVALGLVALGFTLWQSTGTPGAPTQQPTAPFIFIDDTVSVGIGEGASRAATMEALTEARKAVRLSLGLVARLYVARVFADQTRKPQEIPGGELLALLAPNIPQSLLRTIEAQYLLGAHSFDENQGFLVLKVDSYEAAYAGMLQWEPHMQNDLKPLITRNIVDVPIVASSTATSYHPQQTIFATTSFVDRIVENHDARVVQTSAGTILLLWTFLDKHTLLITTNEYTLREVVSRASSAPIEALPR